VLRPRSLPNARPLKSAITFAALRRVVEPGVKRLGIRFGSAEPINLAIEKAAAATGDLFELEFG